MPIKIENPEHYASKKIKTEEEVIKIVDGQKKNGKKVGLCIGGYDLLHPGHMTHLRSAKALCDFLIIGVTAAEFNAGRKGKGRPVYDDLLRGFSLSQLEAVNLVFISKHPGAIEAINLIKPDYYIKGLDYKDKQTPGITAEREAIKSIGGEIRYTNDEKLSTSELINYIKEMKKLLIIADRDGTLVEFVDNLGKNDNWKEEVRLNFDVFEILKFIQEGHDSKVFVITNQSGVAKKYFTSERVEEINSFIDKMLKENGVTIDGWNYCPDVDSKYANANEDIEFDLNFVKEVTKRKPSIQMILELLEKEGSVLEDFEKILVLGDNRKDGELAENLKASFIDVNGKNYKQLKEEVLSIMKWEKYKI